MEGGDRADSPCCSHPRLLCPKELLLVVHKAFLALRAEAVTYHVSVFVSEFPHLMFRAKVMGIGQEYFCHHLQLRPWICLCDSSPEVHPGDRW